MSQTGTEYLQAVADSDYKYGFVTEIDADTAPKGFNEDVVRLISAKKEEPEWMLAWRLKAFRHAKKLIDDPETYYPRWAHLDYPDIDFQDISYYSAPNNKPKYNSLDEVDPKLLETFDRLGISIAEQKKLAGVAVDIVMDSVSVHTTFKEQLAEKGIIFCSFGEAIENHPELVQKYMGSVVPYTDNFYAAMNSAVFSDGSFCYIPKGVRCPMELSTYFRINEAGTGQFERTLIIAEEGSYVSYLEGCTAPMRDENQLHAAVVEIVAHKDAEVKYSTIQNWYPGNEDGTGGVYNFVTKRGICEGAGSKISWTQLETGSAITWKYPSVILKGEGPPAGGHRHKDDPHRQEHQVDDHLQGHLGRQEPELVPRAGQDQQERRERPQLLPVRFDAAGRPLRRAYVPLHRDQQQHRQGGARGHDDEGRRGPDLLLQPARHRRGGRDQADRERLRPGDPRQAPDGVRRRGPQAPLHRARRQRGVSAEGGMRSAE